MTEQEKTKRFSQLQDEFDSLNKDERGFVTWMAINGLIQEYEDESTKTKDRYYKWYLADVIKELERARDDLAFKIF